MKRVNLVRRMSEKEDLIKRLQRFIPEDASAAIAEKIIAENVKLTITKKRKTKLGDYRAPGQKIGFHRISINGDLNPYMFLLVLLHEFAHLEVWNNHKHRVKGHGDEWKDSYRKLYNEYSQCFPEDVNEIILTHFKNLKATTCNDPYLTKHLMHMDSEDPILLLHDLEKNEKFETMGRAFQIISKRRTRYLCKDLMNKKNYLVSGSALVTRLNK